MLKLHGVNFGEALTSHANAQAHSTSCGLWQSTTLEVGKRTGINNIEGKGTGENVSHEIARKARATKFPSIINMYKDHVI